VELVVLATDDEHIKVLRMLSDKIHHDFIVWLGDFLCDIELNKVLDYHLVHESALTVLTRELDLSSKGRALREEADCWDIFGLADLGEAKRITHKTNNASVGEMGLKKSLLRKCPNFTIRTDLQELGIYVFSYWILKLLLGI